MNRDLLELLVDPVDGSVLQLEWLSGLSGREDGLLWGGESRWYPIIDGIPRLVHGELRADVMRFVATRLARHPGRFPSDRVETDQLSVEGRLLRRTAESFGYEWTAWSSLLPAYERNARYYFEPLGVPSLRGVLLADVGCGTGRHAIWAARWGARVVGLDLSPAIEVANRNAGGPATMFVQADLLRPPFRPGTFDAAASFGVLHHLPDPEAGFRSVVALVRPGGRVSIYVYHAFEGQPVKAAGRTIFDALRLLTTRLPFRLMHALAYGLGAAFTIGFVLPARLLRRHPDSRQLAEGLPFAVYADYPFRMIVNDQFDRFATPVEHRYRRRDVEGWFARAGLEQILVLGGGGWRAAGRVPFQADAAVRGEAIAPDTSARIWP